MNFTNLIYMILWMFVYYAILIFVPYAINALQAMPVIGTFWSTIPSETIWLVNILMYIVVPLVAIAYTIRASSPEQQAVRG
jgi:hypothetical protein